MINYNLSEGALKLIMEDQEITDPIMQVLAKKIIMSTPDKERYRILLSDGKNTVSFAMLTRQVSSGVVQTHSVIKLKKFITSVINNVNIGDRKVLLILDWELIADGNQVGKTIGNPTPLGEDKTPSTSNTTFNTNPTKPSLNGTSSTVDCPNPVLNQSKMVNYNLSKGALELIMEGYKVTDPIMQVLGSKKIGLNISHKERYRILLCDGENNVSFAMLTAQVSLGGVQTYSVIKLKNYVTSVINFNNADKKVLVILDWELIADGNQLRKAIGNPTPLGKFLID